MPRVRWTRADLARWTESTVRGEPNHYVLILTVHVNPAAQVGAGQRATGEEAHDGGAIVVDGLSSSVVTGTVILATPDRAEGTYA